MTNKKILILVSLLLVSLLLVGCMLPTKNHIPVITTTTLPDATVETAYSATVEATDADDDTLTYEVVGPTDMVISGAGVISGWTPAEVGTEDITVTVTDGKDSVSADFTIMVRDSEHSTYAFQYDVPDKIVARFSYTIPVTFLATEVKELGYDEVLFRFSTYGSGDGTVTFSAIWEDDDGNPFIYTTTNEGFWGPPTGFKIPADYSATVDWTLEFSNAGKYTITFWLSKASDSEVVDGITESQEITVVAAN